MQRDLWKKNDEEKNDLLNSQLTRHAAIVQVIRRRALYYKHLISRIN